MDDTFGTVPPFFLSQDLASHSVSGRPTCPCVQRISAVMKVHAPSEARTIVRLLQHEMDTDCLRRFQRLIIKAYVS